MNEKEDILNNGGLEGLKSYTVFRRRVPGFRRYNCENVKAIDRWHLKICKNNSPRLPYKFWMCVVGYLRDGTLIQSSPVLEIESPRLLVTENSRYRLEGNIDLRKTLPHEAFGREELNRFLNGFPRDWMNIFRRELEKIYGKGLYSTEEIVKREIVREIDKVYEETLREKDSSVVRSSSVRERDRTCINLDSKVESFMNTPEDILKPVIKNINNTVSNTHVHTPVLNTPLNRPVIPPPHKEIIQLPQRKRPSHTARSVKGRGDPFENILDELLVNQKEIESLLNHQKEKEGVVNWLENPKEETVGSKPQETKDKNVMDIPQDKNVMDIPQDKNVMDIPKETSKLIPPQDAELLPEVKTLVELASLEDFPLESEGRSVSKGMGETDGGDLFESILKDAGLSKVEEQESMKGKENSIKIKEDSIKEQCMKGKEQCIKEHSINSIKGQSIKEHSINSIKEQSKSSIKDPSLSLDSLDLEKGVESPSKGPLEREKRRLRRKTKAIEKKAESEEAVRSYIKDLEEEKDYVFEKRSKVETKEEEIVKHKETNEEEESKEEEIVETKGENKGEILPHKEQPKEEEIVETKGENKGEIVENNEQPKEEEIVESREEILPHKEQPKEEEIVETKGENKGEILPHKEQPKEEEIVETKGEIVENNEQPKEEENKGEILPHKEQHKTISKIKSKDKLLTLKHTPLKSSLTTFVGEEDPVPSSQISVSSVRSSKKPRRKQITMPKDFRLISRRLKKEDTLPPRNKKKN